MNAVSGPASAFVLADNSKLIPPPLQLDSSVARKRLHTAPSLFGQVPGATSQHGSPATGGIPLDCTGRDPLQNAYQSEHVEHDVELPFVRRHEIAPEPA